MIRLTATQSLESCLEDVRRLDHDRFLTLSFAPEDKRAVLIALYAFNAELTRVRAAVSEPMLGQIRLQWWRETIAALSVGELRGHEAAVALASVYGQAAFPADELLALIDARERDLDDAPFADMNELEIYAEATHSSLTMLAARALSPLEPSESELSGLWEIVRPAGIALGLTVLLRALPVHAAQGRLYLPLDLMREHDIDPHKIFQGEMSDGLRSGIAVIARHAKEKLAEARSKGSVGKRLLPALLPVSLCDRYLDIMTDEDFVPFRDSTEVPAFRRQLRLMRRNFSRKF